MGKFVYRVPDPPKPHVHDTPNYEHGLKTGDVWQCNCMAQFMATVELQEDSQVQYNVYWRPMWPDEYK